MIILLSFTVVINKYLIGQYCQQSMIPHTLPHPLTGTGSILNTDFICSIKGSMDIYLSLNTRLVLAMT